METIQGKIVPHTEAGAFTRTIMGNSEGVGFTLQWKTWERNKKSLDLTHKMILIFESNCLWTEIYISQIWVPWDKKSGREVNKVDDHKFLNDIFRAK